MVAKARPADRYLHMWIHGNTVQRQKYPQEPEDVTIIRWGWGAELSLAPSSNPPKDNLYWFNFSLPTLSELENKEVFLESVTLVFDTFFAGLLHSVGSSGEIRHVNVYDGANQIATFDNLLLEGPGITHPFWIGHYKVSTAISISLGFRFNPDDRGAFLLTSAGATFVHDPN